MYGYNPFGKSLDDLSSNDLAVLQNVPEGWYVEYKREIPNARSIAKSLSAFANTFGGWLFYGVGESSDGKRLASEFVGIPTTEVPNAEQVIRQAASTLISPTPTFELKVLYGPVAGLNMAQDRAIIVIGIPAGNNAPFLHGSGVIYRRVADSSEPRPETDRHFLDLLWQRSKGARKEFSKFIRKKPKLSEREADMSTIRICFFPDPWGERLIFSKLNFDDFARIMGSDDPKDGGIPFDSVFPARNSFLARQVKNNNTAGIVFSWRYYNDCASEVVLPLNSLWIDDLRDAARFLRGYEQAEPFLKRCFVDRLSGFYLVDLSQVYSIILSIITRKKTLLEREGLKWNLSYKVQLTNFWRRVPFVDLQEMSLFADQHGIPVVQDNTTYDPPGYDPDSCREVRPQEHPDIDPESSLEIDAGLIFFSHVQLHRASS